MRRWKSGEAAQAGLAPQSQSPCARFTWPLPAPPGPSWHGRWSFGHSCCSLSSKLREEPEVKSCESKDARQRSPLQRKPRLWSLRGPHYGILTKLLPGSGPGVGGRSNSDTLSLGLCVLFSEQALTTEPRLLSNIHSSCQSLSSAKISAVHPYA